MSQQIVEMKTKSTFTKEDAILRPMSDESMNGQMSVGLGVRSETFYETALRHLYIYDLYNERKQELGNFLVKDL